MAIIIDDWSYKLCQYIGDVDINGKTYCKWKERVGKSEKIHLTTFKFQDISPLNKSTSGIYINNNIDSTKQLIIIKISNIQNETYLKYDNDTLLYRVDEFSFVAYKPYDKVWSYTIDNTQKTIEEINLYETISMSECNHFYDEIFKESKLIKSFSLKEGSVLGDYIRNYVNQPTFKYDQSTYVNFDSQNIYYYGIDRGTGVLTKKMESITESLINNDNTITLRVSHEII